MGVPCSKIAFTSRNLFAFPVTNTVQEIQIGCCLPHGMGLAPNLCISTSRMDERSRSAITGGGAMGDRAENEFSSRTSFHRARSHRTRFTVLAYLSAATLSGNIPPGLFTVHVEYPPSIRVIRALVKACRNTSMRCLTSFPKTPTKSTSRPETV